MSAEKIAEVLAEHRHPGELLTALGEAWLTCSHRAEVLASLLTAEREAGYQQGGETLARAIRANQ